MKLKLTNKLKEASATFSFFWEPEKPVTYLPGQYFYFTVPKLGHPDSRGATRHLTLSSSPTEGNTLRCTTRVREESGYKKTLGELPLGSTIEGEGPNGTFTFDENEKASHVFLAGGIGITPFRSMIKYAFDKGAKTPIHLVYSNSLPEEMAFYDELETISKNFSSFKLSVTISKPELSHSPWPGLTGRIDAALLNKVLTPAEINEAVFWVCGPPPMVTGMEQVLPQLNIPSGRIRSEKFTGY